MTPSTKQARGAITKEKAQENLQFSARLQQDNTYIKEDGI